MTRTLEVLFTPAEFAALTTRDLSHTTCVVFDVLRATSSMVTALANGATAIIPVSEIAEALALKRSQPDLLLGGERNGLRITANLTGGTDFDFGNSPREYTAAKVAGKTIVSTTTNGTRALRACAGAGAVFAGSFLNLAATARTLAANPPENVLLVCSGTHAQAAYEDTLAAGALCDLLWAQVANEGITDSARVAWQVYLAAQADLPGAMQHSRNARRLLALPELRDDVAFCLQRDVFNLAAIADGGGRVVKAADFPAVVI
jgi:2-phosphosulfolactate phosphatase